MYNGYIRSGIGMVRCQGDSAQQLCPYCGKYIPDTRTLGAIYCSTRCAERSSRHRRGVLAIFTLLTLQGHI